MKVGGGGGGVFEQSQKTDEELPGIQSKDFLNTDE